MDKQSPLLLSNAEIARRLALANNTGTDSLADRDICIVCYGHQVYKAGPEGKPIMVKCPGCGGGKSG